MQGPSGYLFSSVFCTCVCYSVCHTELITFGLYVFFLIWFSDLHGESSLQSSPLTLSRCGLLVRAAWSCNNTSCVCYSPQLIGDVCRLRKSTARRYENVSCSARIPKPCLQNEASLVGSLAVYALARSWRGGMWMH